MAHSWDRAAALPANQRATEMRSFRQDQSQARIPARESAPHGGSIDWLSPVHLLPWVILISVLLRIGIALYLGNTPYAPPKLLDQVSYHALGERLVTGHGFSFDRGWYPFTYPDQPTAHWSFLESLLVAGIYRVFGIEPLTARLVHAVAGGILLPWLVYRFALRYYMCACPALLERQPNTFGTRPASSRLAQQVALLAALLSAFYVFFALYAATIMTETFYIVTLLWSMERALALADVLGRGTGISRQDLVVTAAGLGMALGLATLFRQSILPWVVVLFLWALWAGRRSGTFRDAILACGLTTGIIMLCILPFTIRNYRVYGSFLLLNSNAGYAMYSAQHPMHGTSFQEYEGAPVPEELLGLDEATLDRELMRRGVGFVVSDPRRYLLLSLSRVRDYFEFWPTPDSPMISNIGRVLSFGLFLPFMIYGLYLGLRRCLARNIGTGPPNQQKDHLPAAALPYLFIGFYTMLHILTWAMPRYRLPVDATAMPFAAVAIFNFIGRIPGVQRYFQPTSTTAGD